MAIEKKSLKDMPASVRAVYQKAMDVIAAGADGYGVELLKGIIQ